jgi:hypothetical protein
MRKPEGPAAANSCNNAGAAAKLRKGLWSPEEDEKLVAYMLRSGQGSWSDVARNAGLQRCGKSCRLRWINYLRPDLKRGAFSPQEEEIIVSLHAILGNRYPHTHGSFEVDRSSARVTRAVCMVITDYSYVGVHVKALARESQLINGC